MRASEVCVLLLDRFLALFDEPDLVSLVILAIIFNKLGDAVVDNQTRLRAWGRRTGVGVLAFYLCYAVYRERALLASELLWVLVRALLAGWISSGAAQFAFGLAAFVYVQCISRPLNWLRTQRVRRSANRPPLSVCERPHSSSQNSKPVELTDEEKQERLTAAREAATAQKRREDARAGCELLFHRFAPELGDRFPRSLFDELLARYLDDNRDAEYVEERARQIEELIRQHCEQVDTGLKAATMADLSAWFDQQKKQLDTLPMDDRLRRVHLANLNRRFAELMTNLLERMKP